jgi:hypothetical protein
MAKQIAALEAQNAQLRKDAQSKAAARVTIAVSSKGAISVYGLGRFPTTMYVAQWDTLLAHIDTLKAFIAEGKAAKAFATDKTVAFVQPNNLPLKLRAKEPSKAPSSPDAL